MNENSSAVTTVVADPDTNSVRTPWAEFRRKFRKQHVAVAAGVFVLLLVAMAVAAPHIAPFDAENFFDYDKLNNPPSLTHWFGVDPLGRDIFSRIVVGTRNIFLIGGFGTLVAVVIGTAIGLASGYMGGAGDEVIMRLLDVLLSFPSLLLAMVLLAAVGPSNLNIVLVVAILYIPMVARVVRSMVLDLKNKEFVEAARVRGEKRSYILFREILPNSLPPLLVEASMRFSYSIFLVASLGYLGLGVQPPSPDWGLQINEARNFFQIAPWVLLFPACTIAVLVISTNLMSDGLRQVMLPGGGRN